MIAVTGACGFIGSVLVGSLNRQGLDDILVVDDFEIDYRVGFATRANYTYLQNKKFKDVCPINNDENDPFLGRPVDFIFHLGAISDTLCDDQVKINHFNVRNTECLSSFAQKNGIPMVFASSASVVGNGTGPLNMYARSKMDCENILRNHACIFRIFNAYGPNEYHKGQMASMIYRWFKQASTSGFLDVFEGSDHYLRDFVSVHDICSVLTGSYRDYRKGIFDLGTGSQCSFQELADIVASEIGGMVRHIEMPSALLSRYQTNTKSDSSKILDYGWIESFQDVESGVRLYMRHLLDGEKTI